MHNIVIIQAALIVVRNQYQGDAMIFTILTLLHIIELLLAQTL
jgi:hypothetical protein